MRAYTQTTSAGVPVSSRQPLVIHIFLPLSFQVPSGCCSALVESPSTSVPASGSDMAIAPIHSPEHTLGSILAFCSSLPLYARLLTNSIECARYARAKPGSEADNSSWTIAHAAASRPAPPYSSGALIPKRPSSPIDFNSSRLKSSFLSCSKA